ncbi:A/G-specific adenine glycosylase [Aquibacillus kalidii]|uniref:A/G-specific adenine glycosylase n=1 Tax=Aquibacillus kalidii TaxID=2762597 RepID=UPI0016477372|nr:A/G-specific adenine glycosylase [Aquibacillus kalidii]
MKNNDIESLLQEFDRTSFQADLINWFEKEKRDLPWRQDQDPYKVWVSEIMLQQTKVDTVIPYFNNFIEKFPTLADLAEADEQDVLKAWEGLGYYSRARNLQTAVREVVSSYDSKVPDVPEEVSGLKGVGPYTTGAILSIAYGVPEPAVDGNVMRVLSRILQIEKDIAKQSTRKIFEACVRQIISKANPSSFNQGLMELGALICTPKSPSCLLCPVQEHCKAFENGIQEQLPVKSKAKKQKHVQYFSYIIKDKYDNYLVEQRPDSGLLANLWQFPMVPSAEVDVEHATQWISQVYGIEISVGTKLKSIKHVFSHLTWDIQVFEATCESGSLTGARAQFIPLNQLTDYPFPVSHQKIREQIILK